MFVVSVKKSAIKTGALGVLLVVCAVFGVYAAGRSVSATVESAKSGFDYKAADSSGRLKFLSQFGWEVEQDPVEVREIIIPAEFDAAYEHYNELQQEHGLDLSKYCGKRAKRWTYEVKNYPGYEGSDLVQANIFVLDGVVIGGDICSLETNGFMQSFIYPQKEKISDNVTAKT
ncbi:MAG: DUF4830 domain-containing protein [Clostridia bacterium]|nr:DUF4830 domain-containing protein [Clostridia bacterium]